MTTPAPAAPPPQRPALAEVFAVFLRLGLTSFGGPVAHLGYFRTEFVTQRRWLSDAAYTDLVALCQFLPGPTSSQVGFALGLMRGGWLGALAAFVAFTLPSALSLLAFAATATAIAGPLGMGALHGLKIVAVAIVAQAVLGMARSLCPDRGRASIAVLAVAMLAVLPASVGMAGAIAAGAVAGLALGGAGTVASAGAPLALPLRKRTGLTALAVFAGLAVLLPVAARFSPTVAVADAFYRAGALVFGGGHVVLPLLEAETLGRGWVNEAQFLAGYGAAQAVPGPLFSFGAYLGALAAPGPGGLAGAILGLCALFLPGFLILLAVLPFWDMFRRQTQAQALMRGANAAVVGVLAAALYDPVFRTAIGGLPDFALALACFVALVGWQAAPWAVVCLGALGGAGLAALGG